jgi:hypothetical protein
MSVSLRYSEDNYNYSTNKVFISRCLVATFNVGRISFLRIAGRFPASVTNYQLLTSHSCNS